MTAVSWAASDYKLISCASEGAIYIWDVTTGKRLTEVVVNKCRFTGTQITSDARITFAVGSDGETKEIIDGMIRTARKMEPSGLDCMALARGDKMLFVSGDNGNMYSLKLPLSNRPEDQLVTSLHNKTITKVRNNLKLYLFYLMFKSQPR